MLGLLLFATAVALAAAGWFHPWALHRRRLLARLARELAEAVRRGDPLPGLLRSFAPRDTWASGRAARRLADRLEKGETFARAAAEEPVLFPEPLPRLLAAAEAFEGLDRGLDEVSRRAWEELRTRLRVLLFAWYPLLLAACFLLAGALVSRGRLLEKLSAALPASGSALPAGLLADLVRLEPLVVFGALPLVLAGVAAVLALAGRGSERARLRAAAVRRRLPGLGRLARLEGLERLSRALGATARRGEPLHPALRAVAPFLEDPSLGNAARQAAAALEEGASVEEALESAGSLPAPFRWHAAVAARSPEPGPAFDALAEDLLERRRRWADRLGWGAAAAAVVVLGLHVGLWELVVFRFLLGSLEAVS